MVAFDPETAQTPGVADPSMTGRVELPPVAAIVTAASPMLWLPIGGSVICCGARLTVNERVTDVAAKKSPLPSCDAATVQVPAPTMVTLAALTTQTPGVDDASPTGRSE